MTTDCFELASQRTPVINDNSEMEGFTGSGAKDGLLGCFQSYTVQLHLFLCTVWI